MKKLPIKGVLVSEVNQRPDGSAFVYSIPDELKGILRSPLDPNRGADAVEIEASLSLIRKVFPAIKAGEEFVLIENSEHAVLVPKMKASRYVTVDPPIVEWQKLIATLPDIEVTEKPA